MIRAYKLAILVTSAAAAFALLAGISFAAVDPSAPEAQRLNDILERTAGQTSVFLDQFSDVKCTEQVRQEKLGQNNKIELKEESTYDYLVILTNAGGELSLSESRIPVHEAKKDRKNTSMLLSNGFATLFLVFHPIYADAFRFTLAEQDVVAGRTLQKITFQHITGMKSPAALAPSRRSKLVSPTACRMLV